MKLLTGRMSSLVLSNVQKRARAAASPGWNGIKVLVMRPVDSVGVLTPEEIGYIVKAIEVGKVKLEDGKDQDQTVPSVASNR